jgi:hypothetical protein
MPRRATLPYALLQQIGAALEAEPTLGGLAFGLSYGRPETSIEAVAGRAGDQERDAHVTIDCESDVPLAGACATPIRFT